MELIPTFNFKDEPLAVKQLVNVFGFQANGDGMFELGDQKIILNSTSHKTAPTQPHHIALSVDDIDLAVKQFLENGATLTEDFRKEPIQFIDAFWGAGIDYSFFEGPEGVFIELCRNREKPKAWGHDHIGINVADLDAAIREWRDLGADKIESFSIKDDSQETNVQFIQYGKTVVELFCFSDKEVMSPTWQSVMA